MPHYFDNAHREEIETLRQRLTARTEWPTWLLLVAVYAGWFSLILASARLGVWWSTLLLIPLLVVGVFIVGMVRQVIRPEWIESLAGSNTVLANAVAVGFGVFMYFPTLVEVPVARMFLDLGMHPGPLLAYLMADPELSLQSMLMVAAVIGRQKTAAYVGLVALFSICAGLLYGAWVDGLGWLPLSLVLGLFIAVLAAGLIWLRQRQRRAAATQIT